MGILAPQREEAAFARFESRGGDSVAELAEGSLLLRRDWRLPGTSVLPSGAQPASMCRTDAQKWVPLFPPAGRTLSGVPLGFPNRLCPATLKASPKRLGDGRRTNHAPDEYLALSAAYGGCNASRGQFSRISRANFPQRAQLE